MEAETTSIIDIVFVSSLALLTLATIIFLVFFVPVLVQLAKVLESLKALVDIGRDYVEGVRNKINNAGHNVGKLLDYASALSSTLGKAALDLIFSSRK
ncbi:MAG: hypothetical protein OXU45_08770 [Candidatus Melainabacteria bacterium]|nr:hypothetical protein [Candidatus Melainabacteria bacterium]